MIRREGVSVEASDAMVEEGLGLGWLHTRTCQ